MDDLTEKLREFRLCNAKTSGGKYYTLCGEFSTLPYNSGVIVLGFLSFLFLILGAAVEMVLFGVFALFLAGGVAMCACPFCGDVPEGGEPAVTSPGDKSKKDKDEPETKELLPGDPMKDGRNIEMVIVDEQTRKPRPSSLP